MRYRFRARFLGLSTALHAAPFVSIVMVFPDACPQPHGATRVRPVVVLDRPLELFPELPRANAANDQVELAREQDAVLAEQSGTAPGQDQMKQEERTTKEPPLPRGPHFALSPNGERPLASLVERSEALARTASEVTSTPPRAGERAGNAHGARDVEAAEASVGAPDARQEQIVAIVAKINRTVPQAVPIAYVTRPALTAAGIATVQFTLRRDGSVDEMRVATTNGQRDLDSSARRLLLMAQPFDYLSGWVEVTLAFFK